MTAKWLMNADVGEGCDDSLIMPYLDCANICCGAHAGGETEINTTLELCKTYGVNAGAHPGYADRENFGRLSLTLSPDAITRSVREQVLNLITIAKTHHLPVLYVKPHGALNHDMLAKPDIFAAICAAVAGINPNLALMVPTNAKQEEQTRLANEFGLTIWWEVFADRAYEPNGLLRSRQYPDAMHQDPTAIVAQIERIMTEGKIRAIDGTDLDIRHSRTICLHGDHSPSVTAARLWKEQSQPKG